MLVFRTWFTPNPGYWPQFIVAKIWRFENWMVGEKCVGEAGRLKLHCAPDGEWDDARGIIDSTRKVLAA